MSKIIINIDGGSRGNPGPSALGVVISGSRGEVIKKYSHFLGKATNNQAEYQALIFALKKIKALLGKEKAKKTEIEIKSDSQLLVSQMNGVYKIKEKVIQELFLQAWNLKVELSQIKFISIPREQNKLADQLANQALDQEASTQKLF